MKSTTNPFGVYDQGIPSGKLEGKFQKMWVEDALDIEEPTSRHVELVHTNSFIGTSINGRRVHFFLCFILVIIGVILARVIYLQIGQGTYYRALAENNRIRFQPILAERGIIYDRFGKELVQNVPNFNLTVIPDDLPRDPTARQTVLQKLSTLSGIAPEDIESSLQKYSSYNYNSITIKENLDYDTALKLYIQNGDLPGIAIEGGSQRRYLTTTSTQGNQSLLSFSHILGYVGKNEADLATIKAQGYLPNEPIGKNGIEKVYEQYLRGDNGRKRVETDAAGREQNVLAVDPPKPGEDVYLTIDEEAQAALEAAVKKESDLIGKHRIAAVAMDPNNGEILAMVSWPSFDSNDFAGGIASSTYATYRDNPDNPLFNRAISGSYPPGSTAKLVVAAAGLQEKIITKNTTMDSVGGFDVGGTFFRDWKVGGHGITNVIKALTQSVNSFFYYVGGGYKSFEGLGIDRLTAYMRKFGMGQKTGIDLPGENAGLVPDNDWKMRTYNEKWYIGDTYNLSIGEGGLLVTPLQDAVWTAAIANGGKIVTPHVTQKMYDPTTKQMTAIQFPDPRPSGVSAENIAVVQEGMFECVNSGSCITLKSLPFSTAGKTGTAQWNKNKDNQGWFTSYAPYEHPQIVVTVLVEEGGEGAFTARPIAKDFLAWWGKKYLHE